MAKSIRIHKLTGYDLEERLKAFWRKHKVEFTKEEFELLEGIKGVKVIFEWGNKVLVRWSPKVSGWEHLFK